MRGKVTWKADTVPISHVPVYVRACGFCSTQSGLEGEGMGDALETSAANHATFCAPPQRSLYETQGDFSQLFPNKIWSENLFALHTLRVVMRSCGRNVNILQAPKPNGKPNLWKKTTSIKFYVGYMLRYSIVFCDISLYADRRTRMVIPHLPYFVPMLVARKCHSITRLVFHTFTFMQNTGRDNCNWYNELFTSQFTLVYLIIYFISVHNYTIT